MLTYSYSLTYLLIFSPNYHKNTTVTDVFIEVYTQCTISRSNELVTPVISRSGKTAAAARCSHGRRADSQTTCLPGQQRHGRLLHAPAARWKTGGRSETHIDWLADSHDGAATQPSGIYRPIYVYYIGRRKSLISNRPIERFFPCWNNIALIIADIIMTKVASKPEIRRRTTPSYYSVGRCGVVGSTLAFGFIGHGLESEHRLFSHHSASAFSKLRSLAKCSLDDSVRQLL